MVQTTRLQLPLIAAAQAQKHVTHNEAVMRLDGLVQMTAKSYTTAAQPGAPSDGDLYLLPSGKTGSDWGGYSNHAVAHYYDGVWHQYHPNAGWLCWVQDTSVLYYYTGSAWSAVPLPTSLADGTASAPGLAFAADTNTGLYRIGADQLGIATGGTLRRTISTSAETPTLPQQGADGSAATPQYGFSADTDNGLYRSTTNTPAMAAGGSAAHLWSLLGNTQPLQPAFYARLSASTTGGKTGDGTEYTVIFDTEEFDVGNNFNNSTGVFTAPVTGKYFLGMAVRLQNLNADTYEEVYARIYYGSKSIIGSTMDGRNTYSTTLTNSLSLVLFGFVSMAAGDTAYVAVEAGGGAKSVNIMGSSVGVTFFNGYLVS
jgi:hypothetical protein